MTSSGERTFTFAATLELIEKGEDLRQVPHMTILRWLHEDMPWSDFETRLQALFKQPNPFSRPDVPQGTRVARQPLDTNASFTELIGVSKWPYLGVGALIRSLEGRLVNEEFTPRITGVETTQLGLGSRVRFASVAVAQHHPDSPEQAVLFAHPITNTPNARG